MYVYNYYIYNVICNMYIYMCVYVHVHIYRGHSNPRSIPAVVFFSLPHHTRAPPHPTPTHHQPRPRPPHHSARPPVDSIPTAQKKAKAHRARRARLSQLRVAPDENCDSRADSFAFALGLDWDWDWMCWEDIITITYGCGHVIVEPPKRVSRRLASRLALARPRPVTCLPACPPWDLPARFAVCPSLQSGPNGLGLHTLWTRAAHDAPVLALLRQPGLQAQRPAPPRARLHDARVRAKVSSFVRSLAIHPSIYIHPSNVGDSAF